MQNSFPGRYLFFIILITCSFSPSYAMENSTLLYKRGAALARQGKIDEAVKVFKRVIEVSPYYTLGHYGLGKSYLHMRGKLDDAITHLETAVRLDRSLARGYFYLGMAYLLADKLPRAAAAFDRAFRLDNTMIEALFNLGVVYDRMKNSYKAGVYYRLYLERKERKEEERIF